MSLKDWWTEWNKKAAQQQQTVQEQLALTEIIEKLRAMQTAPETIDQLLKILTEQGMDEFTQALGGQPAILLQHPSAYEEQTHPESSGLDTSATNPFATIIENK